MKVKIRRSAHVAARKIEGLSYVINTKTSTLHELDEVGTFIWELTDKTTTPLRIAEKICGVYDVTREEALDDTLEFLNKLKNKGLIDFEK